MRFSQGNKLSNSHRKSRKEGQILKPILRFSVFILLLFGIFTLLGLSACTVSNDAPAQTIERYYQALAEKDQDQLTNLSCAEWETSALMELDSFMNVETTLQDVECQTVHQGEDKALVNCTGAIAASYEGELREFPISGQTYRLVLEAGEWRMCGYE